MKNIIYLSVIVLVAITALSACSSQKSSLNNTNTSDLVSSRSFTFVAQSVFPTEDARYNVRNMFPNGSNLYQLTSRYDVRVTSDSVIAYLPFFGRAYTAPVNPSEGGIKFTSTKFSYRESIRKKNYEIEIVPQDNNDVRNIFITISPNGFASLRVLSVNKTPIAYNGTIESNENK